jgi:hypothetical protein
MAAAGRQQEVQIAVGVGDGRERSAALVGA